VEGVIPRPDVAALLADRFVALAADADDTEPEVEELAMNLEDAYSLPFVMVTDAQGRLLEGASGALSPAGLTALLRRALERVE
jgi:hypothetical protein